MSNLGCLQFCLGMEIIYDKVFEVLSTNQQEIYSRKKLHTYKMLVCNLTITPMEAWLKLNKSDSPQHKEEKTKMVNIPYQSVVCNLMHAMVSAWPNIKFYLSNLGDKH